MAEQERATRPSRVDISAEIEDWRSARYGRQVRSSNISALEKLCDQANAAMDYIDQKGTEIDQVRQDVDEVRQNAQDAVDHANDITAEYKGYADDKLAAAEQERQKAELARQEAESQAKTAESWAVGGTGTREGENTDNAAYYSVQAQTQADRSKDEADRAAQYSTIVAPGFYLDEDTAVLYIKSGIGVDFLLQEAQLYWKITA